MGRYVERTWFPVGGAGLPRRAREACRYRAFIPDSLADVPVALDGPTLADLSEAERRIALLNSERGPRSHRLAALARFLLRAEAVGSSWIEGLVVGSARLARAEARQAAGRAVSDRLAAEVVGNVETMRLAVGEVAARSRLEVDDILRLHRVLLSHTPNESLGGVLRTGQNWIGGSGFNPCAADFVPPPPGEVPPLIEDLVVYANRDDVPPLLQAGLVHAQFEVIHPFADGNGRTGRALLHVVLVRRGLAPIYVPPISLVLATLKDAYVAGLRAFAYEGSPRGEAAAEGVRRWLATFTAAAGQAASAAERLSARLDDLVVDWRRRAAPIRGNSAADLLIDALPGSPVVTVASAARLVGRSEVAVNAAIARLVDAGVLAPATQHMWGRTFEAKGVLDMLTWFERAAASPAGDTAAAPPARPAPAARSPRRR